MCCWVTNYPQIWQLKTANIFCHTHFLKVRNLSHTFSDGQEYWLREPGSASLVTFQSSCLSFHEGAWVSASELAHGLLSAIFSSSPRWSLYWMAREMTIIRKGDERERTRERERRESVCSQVRKHPQGGRCSLLITCSQNRSPITSSIFYLLEVSP